MCAIEVCDLSKTFGSGRRATKALDRVDLEVGAGEMVALIGASGSGKSTLIRHLVGLTAADRDGDGRVSVLGQTVQSGSRVARGIRATRANIGVVFQQFNLVGRLSLLTNVMVGFLGVIPVWRSCLGLFSKQEKQTAMRALQRVDLADYATQRASTLSGGQQQRAAIARALVQNARVILADEPIASLDPETSRKVMENLRRINDEDGVTVVVSLHQVDYAIRYCPRTVALHRGRIVYDGPSEALTPALLKELYGSESDELLVPQAAGHAIRYPPAMPQPQEAASLAAV